MSVFTPRILRLPTTVRLSLLFVQQGQRLRFSSSSRLSEDPRIQELGKVIKDEFAVLREDYGESLLRVLLTWVTIVNESNTNS